MPDPLVNNLFSAAMYAAPNSKVQDAFTTMVEAMEGDGASRESVAIAICDGISDGFRHGNWPS